MTTSVSDLDRTPLEYARENVGLTRHQLAVLAGLNPETVARIERGDVKPQKATLFVLAVALGVEPSSLENDERRVSTPGAVKESATVGPTNEA